MDHTWPSDVKLCQQEDSAGVVCKRPVHSKGFCALHFTRWRNGMSMVAPIGKYAKPVTVCSEEHCEYPAYARTFCSAHYQRHRDGREFDRPIFRKKSPLADRAKVWFRECDKVGDCWVYPRTTSEGYPTSVHDEDGRSIHRYRAVYMAVKGDVPKWAQIHHACANRACINPDHLVTATQTQNVAEMHSRREFVRRIIYLEDLLENFHCPTCNCHEGVTDPT